MGLSASPQLLDDFGDRAFSFYPPIVNIEHNEWLFRRGTWSEILVHNPKGDVEVWIPRSYLGEISKVEDPVAIVGLRRELEFKGGSVWPYVRRVIPIPAGPSPKPLPSEAGSVEHRSEVAEALRLTAEESKIGKLIGAVLVIGILICFTVVLLTRRQSTEIEYQGVLQQDLGLGYRSDYYDVVRKLGPPDEDRWLSETGERQYRVLVYKKSDLQMILMGPDRKELHYIGAKNAKWRTVHYVEMAGGTTEAILKSLQKF